MQEGIQEHDERQVERMKRRQIVPTSTEELERIREELILRGFKPYVPPPPKQRRRRNPTR